jgi:arylsulfatase A-like enzyme
MRHPTHPRAAFIALLAAASAACSDAPLAPHPASSLLVRQAVNLVADPGFESKGTGWIGIGKGGRGIDSATVHTGRYSARIAASSLYRRVVYQDVPVAAGASYDVAAWLSTTGLAGQGSAIVVQWLDATALPEVPPPASVIRTDTVGTLAGTAAWTRLATSLVAPAGAVAARVQLALEVEPDNSGRVWFDDIELASAIIDVTPPTVSITAPVDGATLSGTVVLAADASDDVAVEAVKFQVDGADATPEDPTSPYAATLNTAALPAGSYTITAVARDATGNSTTSAAVHVTVASQPANLLLDPGFEAKGQGWIGVRSGGRAIDSVTVYEGRYSLRIIASSLYARAVHQDVGVAGDASYDLAGWLSTTGLAGKGAAVIVYWLSAVGLPEVLPAASVLRVDTVAVVASTHGWTRRLATYVAPSGAVAARLQLVLAVEPDNAGRAWFDDLELRATSATPPVARPDIVLILTDDQRYDLMPYMPLTAARLAGEAVQFQYAFAPTPNCCPARATILTGLYSHNTGVMQSYGSFGGATKFNPTSTIATWLQPLGYRTGLYGKYLNDYFRLSPAVPPGWSEFHAFVRDDDDYYYNYTLNDNGDTRDYGFAEADYSTPLIAAKAAEFIASTPVSQPLFLYFTPFGPHQPATPHPSDIGSFASFPPQRPPSYNESDVSDKPAWVRALPLIDAEGMAASDAFHRSQLETLQSVDRAVATIVDALVASGRWANTRLIFASDNGLMWGEHRIKDTKFCVYEECVRVPLWVRVPGQAPRTDDHLVAQIDFAPTIAEWAGAVPATRMNGMSLVPLLADPATPWRSELLLETLHSSSLRTSWSAVRTPSYLYAEYENGNQELYDLQTDPFQLTNVVGDPAYAAVVQTLRTKLAALKGS